MSRQQALEATRRARGVLAVAVQRRVRGWLWRKRLRLMVRSALLLQCLARCRRARKRVEAERRRRDCGPEVVDLTQGPGKSVTVGELSFFLKVFRCGDNYLLKGVDAVRVREYEGEVRADEVRALIAEHNEKFPGSTLADRQKRIGAWQHERVVDLLISNLGFAPKIVSVSRLSYCYYDIYYYDHDCGGGRLAVLVRAGWR